MNFTSTAIHQRHQLVESRRQKEFEMGFRKDVEENLLVLLEAGFE